MIDLKWCGILL